MKRWIVIIIFIVALGTIIAWRIGTKIATTKSLGQQAAMRKASASNVVTAVAKAGEIEEHLDVVGSISTPYDVKLACKVPGIVEMLDVRPGDRVAANQILVKIDPTEQEAVVAQERGVLAGDEQKYTQAKLTQTPTNTNVYSTIGENVAQVAQAEANENQVISNYDATVMAAKAAVTDAQAKETNAEYLQGAANQAILSAQANYNDASAKYARDYSLYKQGYLAAQSVDDDLAAQKVQEAAVNSAKQSLSAAEATVSSMKAELDSAKQQLAITIKQGESNIVAAKAATRVAKETLKYSRSNTAQIPAYVANLNALKAVVAADMGQLANDVALVQDTVLKTPYPGNVISRLIDPGSMATAGEELLEIQYLDWLYVTCTAPVEYVDQVVPGQVSTLTLDALPGQTFHAQVVQVTPAADPTSRQFTFMVRLDNTKRIFKPGMFAHVDVVIGSTHADVMVPREAVTTGDQGQIVTVVDSKNIAHTTVVTTGVSDTSHIQILSGVKAGDQVVVLAYRAIKDGGKVTIGKPLGSSSVGYIPGTGGGGAETIPGTGGTGGSRSTGSGNASSGASPTAGAAPGTATTSTNSGTGR